MPAAFLACRCGLACGVALSLKIPSRISDILALTLESPTFSTRSGAFPLYWRANEIIGGSEAEQWLDAQRFCWQAFWV